MGPKHAGGHGGGRDHDDNDGPGGRGGQGGQGGRGGGGGGDDVMQLKDRVKKIHEQLEVLKEHGHIQQDDVEKIMKILPNHA